MYKWSQTLRIICTAVWAAIFVLAIVKPEFDTKLPLLVSAALLVLMNLTEFIGEREQHVRETKRPDDQP